MKKIYFKSRELKTYIDAMDGKDDIQCEYEGRPCMITAIRLTSRIGLPEGCVPVRISLTSDDDVQHDGVLPESVKLYRREFEDGDYVRQQDGCIVICAGVQNGRYLFHAAMTPEPALSFPDEFYTYGSVMPDDRLCSEEEVNRMNGALMKEGMFFDPAERKIVDSVFKKNPDLFEKFKKEYERFKDPTDIGLKGFWCSGPVVSQRGKLKSKEEIQECVTAYEARILELTEMCNEIYKKLNGE